MTSLRVRALRRTETGMSLVELMVAVVVMGIVSTIIFGVLSLGSTVASSQAATAETNMAARFATALVAQDLAAAGSGGTSNCQNDVWIANDDEAASCDAFQGAGVVPAQLQALFFVPFSDSYAGLGTLAAANNQFQPDELWVLINPFPGLHATVTGQSGTTLQIDATPTTAEQRWTEGLIPAIDDGAMMELLSSPILHYTPDRGMHSFRAGATPTQSGSTWSVTLAAAPYGLEQRFEASGVLHAARWVHYYLAPEAGKISTHLWREEWANPGATTHTSAVIVATEVVDLQLTFCMDTAYTPGVEEEAPSVVCGLGTTTAEADAINAAPEQVRMATVTIRARTKAEDSSVYAEAANNLTWYDLNGSRADGAARVRSLSQTVSLLNSGH